MQRGTHPASVQLYLERLRFGRRRRLDFEPVLAGVYRLLTLLVQVVESQHLRHGPKESGGKGEGDFEIKGERIFN